MTIEQKIKRYDDALKKAKKLYEQGTITESLSYVFPELKEESESERIRKALTNEFIHLQSKGYKFAGLEGEEIIAWLEKQGELIRDTDTVDSNEDGLIAETIRYKNEKQGEQKPTWSEEDERIYQSIMDDTVQENQLNDKQTNWLRDIKYRYFPQPKQELSKEDEVMIKVFDSIIRYIVEVVDKDALERFGTTREELFSWLKSLRPQSQWKPSDKQIKALANALSLAKNCGEESAFDLRTLYEQLKKLKEE